MKKYYIYILKCADDLYYVGLTGNVTQRLKEHQEGYFEGSY
ncbi:MAG: putative endonuclease, partial [Arenicella sp.]